MPTLKINPRLEGRTYHYKSIADLKNLKANKKTMPNKENWENWERISNRNKERTGSEASEWFGPRLTSYQKFQNALNRGWDYGIKKAKEMSAKVKIPQIESVKRKTFRGREGDFLDIHKVNRGQFDIAWTKRKRASKVTKKCFTLSVHIGGAWTLSADRLFWRGIATVSLAKALVTAGHSVEIVAYTADGGLIRGEKAHKFYTVIVKPFEMPINLSSLVSTICLAGFFRTEFFKAYLTDPKECCSGLGYVIDDNLPDEVLKRGGETVSIPDNLETDYAVTNWLEKTVQDL